MRCSALSFSPQNIIVGVDGTARLTDFGVARATTRLSNTRAGTIKGKVSYMAPEQIKRGQLDRRADLFAMGVILWEALAGRSLFRAGALSLLQSGQRRATECRAVWAGRIRRGLRQQQRLGPRRVVSTNQAVRPSRSMP